LKDGEFSQFGNTVNTEFFRHCGAMLVDRFRTHATPIGDFLGREQGLGDNLREVGITQHVPERAVAGARADVRFIVRHATDCIDPVHNGHGDVENVDVRLPLSCPPEGADAVDDDTKRPVLSRSTLIR
jgi:hypothetical protein